MVTMLPNVVNPGSIPMTGMVVGFVIVLVEDTDHLEVEEEQEGDGDPEQGPQVDPDAQEVVFIEEPDRFGTQIWPRLGHLDEAVKTLSLSLSWNLSVHRCVLKTFLKLMAYWHIFAEKCSFACVSCYLPFPNTGTVFHKH